MNHDTPTPTPTPADRWRYWTRTPNGWILGDWQPRKRPDEPEPVAACVVESSWCQQWHAFPPDGPWWYASLPDSGSDIGSGETDTIDAARAYADAALDSCGDHGWMAREPSGPTIDRGPQAGADGRERADQALDGWLANQRASGPTSTFTTSVPTEPVDIASLIATVKAIEALQRFPAWMHPAADPDRRDEPAGVWSYLNTAGERVAVCTGPDGATYAIKPTPIHLLTLPRTEDENAWANMPNEGETWGDYADRVGYGAACTFSRGERADEVVWGSRWWCL